MSDALPLDHSRIASVISNGSGIRVPFSDAFSVVFFFARLRGASASAFARAPEVSR